MLLSTFFVNEINADIYQNNISKENYVIDPLILSYQSLYTGGSDFQIDNKGVVSPVYTLGIDEETESYDSLKPSDKISYYIVQKGDTVEKIAIKFGLKKDTIISTNNLNSKGFLKIGQKLKILPIDGVEYKIQKGDTVEKIVKKFNLKDPKEFLVFNKLDAKKLVVGSKIIIPGAKKNKRVVKNKKVSTADKVKKNSRTQKSSSSKWIWIKTTDGRTIKHKAWVATKRVRYTKINYGYFTHPMPGSVRTQGLHGKNAIDMSSPINTPILAAHSGVVKKAFKSGYNGGYGHYVLIDHQDGVETLYAHMNRVIVHKGQKVVKGQVIGYEGTTGRSTGPHLHFEVHGRKNPF